MLLSIYRDGMGIFSAFEVAVSKILTIDELSNKGKFHSDICYLHCIVE